MERPPGATGRALRSLVFVSGMAGPAVARAVAAASFRPVTLANGAGVDMDVGTPSWLPRRAGRGVVTEAAGAAEDGGAPGTRRANQPSSAAGPSTVVSVGAGMNRRSVTMAPALMNCRAMRSVSKIRNGLSSSTWDRSRLPSKSRGTTSLGSAEVGCTASSLGRYTVRAVPMSRTSWAKSRRKRSHCSITSSFFRDR